MFTHGGRNPGVAKATVLPPARACLHQPAQAAHLHDLAEAVRAVPTERVSSLGLRHHVRDDVDWRLNQTGGRAVTEVPSTGERV
jgi:hypothetical protein